MPLLISSNPLRSHISSPPRLPPPLNLDIQSKYVTPLALSMPPSITMSIYWGSRRCFGRTPCVCNLRYSQSWELQSLRYSQSPDYHMGIVLQIHTSLRTSCHHKIPVVLIFTMSWCTYACKQLFLVSLHPHAISQSFYSLSFVISHRFLAILENRSLKSPYAIQGCKTNEFRSCNYGGPALYISPVYYGVWINFLAGCEVIQLYP